MLNMNNQTKIVLALGSLLVFWGLFGSKINSVIDNKPVVVDVLELSVPSDENVKKEAQDVVNVLKSAGASKSECRKLRDLMIDLGRLVELDGENEVVKNTEEIRQANSLAGVMLQLDLKGKYSKLPQEAKEVVVAAIGDDNVVLSKELRPKAVDGFNALAWAYNEASK